MSNTLSHRLRLLGLASALVVGACSSMDVSEDNLLNMHLQNAAQYYDRGRYDAAYQQWDKALEYDSGNEKARLGQAMTLYQRGLADSGESVAFLAAAEEALGDLRREDLDGQEWKAELGFALVHERWAELYSRKIDSLEAERERSGTADQETLETSQSELRTSIRAAEESFQNVLTQGEQEAQYQLTCMLGLSKMAAFRADYETSLSHARKYADQVVKSKALWRDAMERYPREAALYERKLAGAERQESELRDLMANVLFKMGRLEEAEDELTIVLSLNPDRAASYLNRGIIRAELGDWDRARQDLRRFLGLTGAPPEDPSVTEANRRLAVVLERIKEEDERALQ